MITFTPDKDNDRDNPVYSDMWSVLHNKDYIGRIKVPTVVHRTYDDTYFKYNQGDRVKYFHDRAIWRVSIVNRFDPIAFRICDNHNPKTKGPYIYSKGPNLILTDSELLTMRDARLWMSKHFENNK